MNDQFGKGFWTTAGVVTALFVGGAVLWLLANGRWLLYYIGLSRGY